MLWWLVCWCYYYNRDGMRKYGLCNKFNFFLLFDIVYDFFWICFFFGIGWENWIEYYCIISYDSFLIIDIWNYVIVWFFNIGVILFCYNFGDWSICGGDDDDFKFLLLYELEDVCLDEEVSDGMVGCFGDVYWYFREMKNYVLEIY